MTHHDKTIKHAVITWNTGAGGHGSSLVPLPKDVPPTKKWWQWQLQYGNCRMASLKQKQHAKSTCSSFLFYKSSRPTRPTAMGHQQRQELHQQHTKANEGQAVHWDKPSEDQGAAWAEVFPYGCVRKGITWGFHNGDLAVPRPPKISRNSSQLLKYAFPLKQVDILTLCLSRGPAGAFPVPSTQYLFANLYCTSVWGVQAK